jgi:nucleoside-diphosphate-sugar epimerase
VIHASLVLVDKANIASFGFIYYNIHIIENTVALNKLLQPKFLINFYSFSAYPNIDGDFLETSQISVEHSPEGLYALSKICSENIFDFYISKSMCVSHLRLVQVFGEGMRDERAYNIFLKELEDTKKISVWGNGERINNFTRIAKLLDIFQVFIKIKIRGVYNIGDHNVSYKDIAQIIIDKFRNNNSELTLVHAGNKAKFNLNLDKLRAFLAQQPLS